LELTGSIAILITGTIQDAGITGIQKMDIILMNLSVLPGRLAEDNVIKTHKYNIYVINTDLYFRYY